MYVIFPNIATFDSESFNRKFHLNNCLSTLCLVFFWNSFFALLLLIHLWLRHMFLWSKIGFLLEVKAITMSAKCLYGLSSSYGTTLQQKHYWFRRFYNLGQSLRSYDSGFCKYPHRWRSLEPLAIHTTKVVLWKQVQCKLKLKDESFISARQRNKKTCIHLDHRFTKEYQIFENKTKDVNFSMTLKLQTN